MDCEQIAGGKHTTYTPHSLLPFPLLLLPLLLRLGLVLFIDFTYLRTLLFAERSTRLQRGVLWVALAKHFFDFFHLKDLVCDPIIIENKAGRQVAVFDLPFLAHHRSSPPI